MHSSINSDQLLRELALSIARNNVGAQLPIHGVIAGEGLTQTEYDQIAANPQFQRYLEAYTTELRENGFSFAAKSRVLAEDLLPVAYHMAKDPDVPAATRAKMIENLVDWGDLKPKNSSNSTAGPGFSITINIPTVGQTPAKTIVLEAENAENPQKTLENAEITEKYQISLAEPDDYVYAGDDYT
jgi:hypothetical protein